MMDRGNIKSHVKINHHSTRIFLSFYWPGTYHLPCKWLSPNNGLLMRKVVQLCSACVWLQVFCSCVKETTVFSFLWTLLGKNGRSLRFPRIFIKKTLGDRMIKQLLNSVGAKYRDLSCVQSRFGWLTLGGQGHSRGLLASPILCTASSQLLFQNFPGANDLACYAGYRSKNSVRWKCPNYFCLRL